MKKIISMMLAIALVFTLSACSKNNTSSDVNSSTPTQVETLSAPENYASVLFVTINPQFKLYLDENNNVLAVEPVNDDAKTFSDEIDFENKSFESVIEIILEKANEKGFVKENATVNFEITEQKAETVSKDDIFQKAVATAEQKATELKITIITEAKKLTDIPVSSEESNESFVSSDITSVPHSSAVQSSVSNAHSADSTHIHKYSSATCTEPKKCVCGATEGQALGHYYQNGKCTRCSEKDPNVSFTSVLKKKGEWKLEYFVTDNDAELYNYTFLLVKDKDGFFGCLFEAASNLKYLDKSIQDSIKRDESDAIVTFNNEEYYFNRGDGDTILMTENQNTITVNSTNGNRGKLVLTRTDENKMVVSESEGNFFGVKIPVGKQLVFESK